MGGGRGGGQSSRTLPTLSGQTAPGQCCPSPPDRRPGKTRAARAGRHRPQPGVRTRCRGGGGGAEFSARKSRRPPSPPSEAVNEIHGASGHGGRSRRRASGDFAPRGSGSVWTERCPDPGAGGATQQRARPEARAAASEPPPPGMFTCSSRGTGVLACSLCPRARRTPKGAGGSPQLRPTGSGRSCTRSRLLLSFFLFSLFWRLRRWRPGCTQAHAVIPTCGIISKMQRVADDEVFSTHPRDPVALSSRKEPRVWARGVSRAAAGTQVGHRRNGDSGHPERAPDAELRPQTPPTGRLPAPTRLTAPSPPRDSAAKRARSPSASNTPHHPDLSP